MRFRNNGGVIGTLVSTSTSTAAGMWSLTEYTQKLLSSTWPTDKTSSLFGEEFFRYNSLLIKAVGANTATNGTLLDSSSSAATITRVGDVTQGTPGPHAYEDGRWGVYFDGTGDYLSVASSTNASNFGTGDFTIECWVYKTGTTTPVITTADNGTDNNYFSLDANSGNTSFQIRDTASQAYAYGPAISNNTWSHVAVTRASGSVTVYVNGVAGTPATITKTVTARTTLIGAFLYTGFEGYFTGYISNLRIVKGTAVYTGAFTPSTSPLTAITNTSLLTCQSNRFKDNSTNNFAITRNGDVKVSEFIPFGSTTPYNASAIGGTIYIDGSSDYVTVPYSTTNFDWWTSDYTLEFWIYLTTFTGTTYNNGSSDVSSVIGNANQGDQTNYWSFGPISNGTARFYYFNGTPQTPISSTETVKLGQWNHLALTKTSSGVTIFVNGVASTTSAYNGTPQSSGTVPLTIGRINGTNFKGYISNLRIVKGTAVYTGNFTLPTAPLTAITNTRLLMSGTNAGIVDVTKRNVIFTGGSTPAQVRTDVVKYDKSMYFDGSTSTVAALWSEDLLLGSGDFTIEFWARFISYSDAKVPLSFGWPSINGPFLFYFNLPGNLVFYSSSNGSSWDIADQRLIKATPATNTWCHVAVTRSGTTFRTFFDGIQSTSWTSSATLVSPASSINLTVGCGSTGGNNLNGYIEDLRITRGYARYTANFTPPTAAFNTL